jgi:hypothetical protein
MLVQVWIEQDGELVPVSDPIVTGNEGVFKVSCTIGDNIRAGHAKLVITASIHGVAAYYPVSWDDGTGNHLPGWYDAEDMLVDG